MASFLLLPVKAGNRLALGAFWGEGRSLRLRSICLARAVNPRLMLGADGAGRGFGVVVVGGGCDLWNNGSNFSAQSF